MGQIACNPCSPQQAQAEAQYNNYAFEYGEDTHQPKIEHQDDLVCRATEIEPILFDCQQRLKGTFRLYKDPTMNTEPIILRSLSEEEAQLKCTFERPHVFLNDPGDLSKGKSRKYKIIDYADSRSSQIVIRDEVMQPFGMLLCFLSEHPNLVKSIILTDTNSYGIAVLRMNVAAKKQYIYIDDYILCSDRVPLFSQPIRGIYMWPCLLEKAWFKVKGYITRGIEKSSPIEIFKSFLSYPVKNYKFVEGEGEFNQKLVQANLSKLDPDKGYFITSKVAPTHKIGISGRKHFYLLQVLEFQGKRLFYMRNPCTSFDFRGSYRILPNELIPILKRQTQEVAIHDGNFILDQWQFYEQVESFSIVHYSKNSQEITEESISLVINEDIYIMMDLKNDSSVSISFIQNNYKENGLKFLPLVYQVVDLNSNTLVSDHDSPEIIFGVENSILFEDVYKQLKPSQYLIRLKKKLNDIKLIKKYDKADKIVVTANCRTKFQYIQQELYQKYFKKFLLQTGRKELKARRLQQKNETNHTNVQYIVFWVGDLAVVYFEKTSATKKEVQVEVKFENVQNLECITHVLGRDYKALDPITDNDVIVFEKINLAEAASLGTFIMDTF